MLRNLINNYKVSFTLTENFIQASQSISVEYLADTIPDLESILDYFYEIYGESREVSLFVYISCK